MSSIAFHSAMCDNNICEKSLSFKLNHILQNKSIHEFAILTLQYNYMSILYSIKLNDWLCSMAGK